MPPRPPEIYGIPIKELARLCRVTERTARRWKAGTVCPPETALMILRRDLGCLQPEWTGWTLEKLNLVSPEGWTISKNDALVVPLMHGQIAALRAQVRDLKSAAEGIEEQPLPGEAPAEISA